MTDEPLLTGPAADEALSIASDLMAALRDEQVLALVHGPHLAGGAAGLAVACAWWGAGPGGPEDREAAEAHLDVALAGIAEVEELNGDLYAGVLGVGWALDQVERAGGCFDAVGDDERDDEVLAGKVLQLSPWSGVHDLTRGLAGLAIHAVEGIPRPAARRNLALVVDRLAESAQETPEGIRWWTSPDTVLPERAAMFPGGFVDLGVAHGQTGVLAALAAAAAAGVEGAAGLARRAADHVWSWRLPVEAGNGRMPSMVVPGEPPGMSRVAWCYGDPGAAWALVEAGAALGDDSLLGRGLDVARAAAARPFERSGCVDPALCHGAAGVAHCLARVAGATGDDEVAEAARRWLRHLVSMRQEGVGLAGYVGKVPDWHGSGELVERPVAGLLDGIAGIALALVSAATTAPPEWDRFLLPQVPHPS